MISLETVPSAVRPDVAISIRNAYKDYGGGWTLNGKQAPTKVLKGLNMTVASGTIYGLLGSSGCGKSTILKAIVGQHRFTSGEVRVLGSVPGSPGAEIPGPAIGYMPQELGLYDEFNIKETLWYFGRIAGLSEQVIQEQTRAVMKLLDLPTHGALVGELSGGQQRRVSFAVALLHRPALLILDEPTVGVDPVLRQSIWDHLMEMVRTNRTTVIITTHYIEEARQAHAIGLMRHGVLLAQAAPDDLLARFGCDNLEDVLLTLSRQQEQHEAIQGHENESQSFVAAAPAEADMYHVTQADATSLSRGSTMWVRFHALLWRNITWLKRSKWVLGVLVIMSIIQSTSFCLSIGRDPKDLSMSIVNDESNCTDLSERAWRGRCSNNTHISCIYIDMISKKDVNFHYYTDLEEAYNRVRKGKSWGVLHFRHNFTESLYRRIEDGKNAPSAVVDSSIVDITMDMTDAMISQLLTKKFQDLMQLFIKDLFSDCGYPREAGSLPVDVSLLRGARLRVQRARVHRLRLPWDGVQPGVHARRQLGHVRSPAREEKLHPGSPAGDRRAADGGPVRPLRRAAPAHGPADHHHHDHDVRSVPTRHRRLLLALLSPDGGPRPVRHVVRVPRGAARAVRVGCVAVRHGAQLHLHVPRQRVLALGGHVLDAAPRLPRAAPHVPGARPTRHHGPRLGAGQLRRAVRLRRHGGLDGRLLHPQSRVHPPAEGVGVSPSPGRAP